MPMNSPRAPLLLLLANFSHPAKDLVATTLAGLCGAQGVHFDAYYATADGDIVEGGGEHHQSHQGGALFSVHGSMVLGGRHHQVVARALATFEATVVKLGEVHLFGHLVRTGAAALIEAEDLADLYERCADAVGGKLPKRVVAVQTEGLPAGLRYGVAQYVFPEALYREAIAAPLELPGRAVKRLVGLGVNEVWTVAAEDADLGAWRQSGLEIKVAEPLERLDSYASLSFRMAEKWGAQASGFDLCEPVLASHWLPFALQEGRVQVCGESLSEAANKLAPLVKAKGERVVYGRYAGGVIGGARDDEDLFGLFKNGIAYQVIEPRRPVLRVLANRPAPLPQPTQTCWDLEPSDEELKTWAAKGKILTTLVFHSGELSHDDAIVNVMDLCALTKVRVGVPVHAQRYTFDPDCVEPMHTPIGEGGVLGLCEPVLHSGGFGILAESLGSPKEVAAMMKDARDEIASVAGERFAPRGVYCYLDALPRNWGARPERLWDAVAEAGFGYLISSVAPGENSILHRNGNFVVLNIGGYNFYPYSPFLRVNSPDQMVAMERLLAVSGAPGWMFGVVDVPIFAYSSYLAMGESLLSVRDPLYRDVRLGKFFNYLRSGGEMQSIISATPHTIARYARLLDDMRREAEATLEVSRAG